MRAIGLVLLLGACGPGAPKAVHHGGDDFEVAVAKKDVAALKKLVRPDTVDGGLLFTDEACAKDFTGGKVTLAKVDHFAECLAGLGLTKSKRSDELPDVLVLTYAPGFELEARVEDSATGPWLASIGFAARRGSDDSLPTITNEALEALRTGGSRETASTSALEDDVTLGGSASAWLKMCIDDKGAVTAQPRAASSPGAARSFAEAASKWTFKPFMVGDKPVAVCAMVELGYPNTVKLANKLPPLPSAADALVVTQSSLGQRLTGITALEPDNDTKLEIQKAGSTRVVGAYHYCIDATGKVTDVDVIRSTGLPSYDQQIMTAIRTWRYRPYLDDSKRVGVCSAQTFVYSQH